MGVNVLIPVIIFYFMGVMRASTAFLLYLTIRMDGLQHICSEIDRLYSNIQATGKSEILYSIRKVKFLFPSYESS